MGAQGGDARRITAHPSYDEQAIFSPDDATLAFGSQRTGGGNIYLISLIGNGRPKRLTFHRGSSPPYCWSPDGQWIYFCSRHDGISRAIYKVHVEGGTPIRIAGEPHEEYYNVAISPDGKRLAFNNNGDPWWRRGPNPAGHAEIWVVSEKPGAKDYRLLTRYRGRNTYPMWSEDGEGLYFLSDRDGVENIWYMPLRGGDRKARQVTFFKEGRLLRPAISRDGRWIVFERDFRLWILEVASGEAHPVDIRVYVDEKHNPVRHHTFPGFIDEFALAPDGKKVAFIVHGTVFADLANKSDAGVRRANSYRVTEGASRESAVTWEPGSTRIAYLSDRTGHNEIFLYDFKTRQEKQLTDSPESKYLPRFSPDGKWLAYIQGHSEIWLMDTQTEEKRPFITGQTFVGVLRPTEFVWSPDSKWIAFIGTDSNFFSNIYVQHLEEDSPRQITFLSNVDAYNLLWAPNGKFIIFNTGHYRKEHQIARVDLVPIPPKFREEEFDKLFQEESSDSSKPASEPEKPPETPAGEARLEAKSNKSGEAAAEKKEDKSAKGEEKKKVEPVEIEFSGIKQRLRFLTDYRLNAKARCIHPNSKVLIFKATMLDEPGLWSLSLEDDESWEMPRQLTTLSYWNGHAEFHHEGKKLYYLNAGRLEIMEMYEDGSRKGYGKTLSTRAELEINFHQQKIQAFNEAWRVIRDYFYDPDYHGCNWDEIYHRFRPIVEGVQTSRDFRELLNLMVGELNASHLGAYGYGSGGADSFLGVDFDRKLLETRGQYKIVHIIPESPLTLPKEPARVGEYLVAVNDVVLDGRTNLDELLQYKRGKRLVLKLNKRPTLKGAREITVQPIGGYRYEDLRYEEWVVRNS
ncbi:MAG: peptidase S41, partial [Calditrichaeota bacterium]